jgi:hypothetical protein
MGFLSWIGRTLAPIVLEHGAPILRDWWKVRMGQSKAKTDHIQELADAVEQLRQHAARMDSNLDTLNNAFTANEEKLRKWVLTLLVWNSITTLALIVLAFFTIRH